MSDPTRDSSGRRWILFGFAVLFGLSTATVLVLSVSGLRDRIGFERLVRRIDILVAAERYDEEFVTAIQDAAEYARTHGQFMRLLRLAWNLEEESRWPAIVTIAVRAGDRRSSDPVFAQIESYARIRTGDRAAAAELVAGSDDPLSQRLRILAEIDPADSTGSRTRLTALGSGEEAPALFVTVARALADPAPADLIEAWEALGARAFAVNAALLAATAGDDATARRASDPLRTRFDPERPLPTLYIAAWLDDDQWLFSQLRSLEGRRVVEPEIFLLQADGHLRQGQFPEARAIFEEILTTGPEASALPFINLAVLNERNGIGDVDRYYRWGLRYHPTSRELRIAWGTRLIRQGRRLEAARVVAPVAVGPGDHETWLLVRAVLGVRRPLARLESDLWEYINSHPDALDVASFLARFLTVRNDREGLAVLRGRYGEETAPWAQIMHARAALEREDWSRAEEIFADGTGTDIAYNRAVFALHHRDRREIDRSIAAYRDEFERDIRITTERRRSAEIRSLLLLAEAARIGGDAEKAIAYLERAELIGFPSTGVSRYRALLAGAR